MLIARQRQRIENRIAELYQLIAQQKSQLNTLTAISVLPPEVLAEIFIYSAQDDAVPYPSGLSHYHLRKVSHICRHWREVALACPALWSGLNVTPRVEWIALMLQRSKQAPLRVNINWAPGRATDMERTCEMVLKESHRIQSLRIRVPALPLEKLLQQMEGPIPLLETLTVINTDLHGPQVEASDCALSTLIQSNFTPRLRRLEITQLSIHWNVLTSATLKHLKVSSGSHQARVDLTDLLNVLEGLPILETIDLEGVVSPVPAHMRVDHLPVRMFTLPRLRSVRIVATTKDCLNILCHLSLPVLSSVNLDCSGNKDGVAVDLALCLADKMSTMAEVRGLYLDEVVDGLTRICGYDSASLPFGTVKHGSEVFTPRVDITVRAVWRPPLPLATICNHLPLSGVRSVQAMGVRFASKQAWLEAFGNLKNLRVLDVYGASETESILALPYALRNRRCIKEKTTGRPSKYRYFLPNLRNVRLRNVRFTDRDNFFADREHSAFLEALVDCLIERYEYGAEIHELQLVQCIHLDKDGVERLKEIVGSVWWDGKVIVDEPEEEECSEEESDEDFEGYSYNFW